MSSVKKSVCTICGHRSRHRCPALDDVICAACCGARRGNEIDCSPECPYFPFGRAAYDRWLKIDGKWQSKALRYVIGKVGQRQFKLKAESLSPPWIEEESAFMEGADAALMYYLVVGKDDDSPPIGGIWKEEGWPGLNNDERYMSEYRCRSMPGIIEIQKVLDDKAMECIDLLDTRRGSFILFDRNTVAITSRFEKIIVWITHYPHFSRLAGNGVKLPNGILQPFLSEIKGRAGKALRDDSDEGVKRYLTENFVEVFELVDSLSEKMREDLIASLDADRCRATYELNEPREDIEAIIEAKPDFEIDTAWKHDPDDPLNSSRYLWLRRGEAKLIEEEIEGIIRHGDEEDGVGSLGILRLTDDELRIETMGHAKFEFAKKLVGSYFKKRLKLVDEEITPLETLMEENEFESGKPAEQSTEISPEIEEQVMKEFYKKQYISFLDEPLPMIDNMTPREASRKPAMRLKLIELIKSHLGHIDTMNLEKGFDINIDWIVDELGLDELK